MRITPPIICACALAAASIHPTALFAGTSSGTSYSDTGVEATAARALERKEEDARRAEAAIQAGDIATKQGDYETAFAQYKLACDLLPDSDATHRLRGKALDGLDLAACDLAEQRIGEGRYEDAKNLCQAVLDPQYDPNCHRAIVILAHLEDPDYYNKTITPAFRGKIEEVKDLMTEAANYIQSAQYDKAYADYEKVLNLDPYNIAARKGQEEVNRYRDQYSTVAYEATRAELLWQLDNSWQMPVHKFGIKQTENFAPQETDVRNVAYITAKLNRIIIPKIEFRDATIREAVDFLKEKSRELDTEEPDPAKRGVNIVLDTGESGGGSPESTPVVPAGPTGETIPGLTPPGTAPGVPGVPTTGVPAVSAGEQRITLELSNIPLIEALHYICELANLKLKIDPYAVAIVPPSAQTDEMYTKEYKVPPGFLASQPNITGNILNAPRGGGWRRWTSRGRRGRRERPRQRHRAEAERDRLPDRERGAIPDRSERDLLPANQQADRA